MNLQDTSSQLILGIESSCDDTAAAVVRHHVGNDGQRRSVVLSSIVKGQDDSHAPFGGVVPEIAARAHASQLDQVTEEALSQAGVAVADLDLIAATGGPGLMGGVMSGLTFAKGLALASQLPLIPVNHLAGHALSVGLEQDVPFPYLLLLVSGGHTQLLMVEGVTQFRRLGTTIDDAAGEAFDKTAKLLGLEGPGGPAIQRLAKAGDPTKVSLPRPLWKRPGCDFSFSGLKTAVRQQVSAEMPLSPEQQADIAAAFQKTAVAHLAVRTENAMRDALTQSPVQHLVAAGGVAANEALRDALCQLADRYGWQLIVPSLRYCTDNAAMIAHAGGLMQAEGMATDQDALAFSPRARWPLDEKEEATTLGKGRKGRKV
ncbi:MAG: tRNA (adenosine(37)-N6)-threonylcarbamoyltransferase complex transferase subunit TsaD [Pseudomonadota bacterium]